MCTDVAVLQCCSVALLRCCNSLAAECCRVAWLCFVLFCCNVAVSPSCVLQCYGEQYATKLNVEDEARDFCSDVYFVTLGQCPREPPLVTSVV